MLLEILRKSGEQISFIFHGHKRPFAATSTARYYLWLGIVISLRSGLGQTKRKVLNFVSQIFQEITIFWNFSLESSWYLMLTGVCANMADYWVTPGHHHVSVNATM